MGMEAAIVASVVSGTLKIVGNKLAPLLIKEYSSMVGVEKDLLELQDQIEEIRSWLETLGDKAVWNDPSFKWLRQLKDIAYNVDDVVDELQQKAVKHDTDGCVVSNYLCSKPRSILFQCKAASKVKSIKKSFASIVKQRTNFNAIANSLQVGHPVFHMNSTTVVMPSLPVIDTSLTLGRDQDKNWIISKLVETNDQQKINIVSIIGLGGSGKTTLAKLVFNDANIIKNHFDVRLWVYVSQEFDVQKLVDKLFEAFADSKSERHPLQHKINKISEKLTEKKFLLVLDDVWTESRIQWEDFMVYLKSGTPGSSILLTTRSNRSAETVGSTYLFDLPLLSPDDSWQLFQQSLMMPKKGWEFEFEDIGKKIVKKCGGVPLAIKVLAGVLHDKEQIEEWQAMRDTNLLDVEGEEHRVSACLMLSYFNLPSHMKQCFTICSVFPKGHQIDKEQLIDQWIAHDMIAPENEGGVDNLEYIGHKYFNSLVKMSFLQDLDEYDGRVTCRMHDLVHDLAQFILGDEISILVPKEATNSTKSYRYFSLIGKSRNLPPKMMLRKTRAIYIAKSYGSKFGKALQNAKHLRSITVEYAFTTSVLTSIIQIKNLRCLSISELGCDKLPEGISDIWCLQALHVTKCRNLCELPRSIGRLRKLRTLNLRECPELKNLPDSVSDCNVISSIDLYYCRELTALPNSIVRNGNLRVLRLGYTEIEVLPSGITTLGNLELLDVQYCWHLIELPEGIENLKKLVVLKLKGCNLRGMPVGIGQLSRLHKLDLFVVGKGNKYAQLSELQNVTSIDGDLAIRYIARMTDPDDAHKACLEQKTKLQVLELEWDRDDIDEVDTEKVLAVLDALEPSSRIKKLYIRWYEGAKFSRWMLKQVDGRVHGRSQFPCLTAMKLSGFPNVKHLDGLLELPCLKELELKDMPALESISGGPFPSLVNLTIDGMPRLIEVWMVIERTMSGEVGGGCSNQSRHHSGQVQIGSCLSRLSIARCPKLEVRPHFPSSLEHLDLCRSNEQLLLSPSQGSLLFSSFPPSFSFSHLKELFLWDMTKPLSSSLPSGLVHKCGWELLKHMTTLESLKIDSDSIIELPDSMRCLTSLRSLHIEICSDIQMLPEWLGELQSLQAISIYNCRSLSGLPQSLCYLTSLQELQIGCCDAVHQLPECLGELRSLRELGISSMQGLTCLPLSMCCLTYLEVLRIRNCPCIKSLPEWIKDLTALEKLEIFNCPNLERNCERGKGENWHLISHIPRLRIGPSRRPRQEVAQTTSWRSRCMWP